MDQDLFENTINNLPIKAPRDFLISLFLKLGIFRIIKIKYNLETYTVVNPAFEILKPHVSKNIPESTIEISMLNSMLHIAIMKSSIENIKFVFLSTEKKNFKEFLNSKTLLFDTNSLLLQKERYFNIMNEIINSTI